MVPRGYLDGVFPRIRWTSTRFIVLGAALGLVPTVLDASLSLNSTLAFLDGRVAGLPFWLVLLNAALVGLLVPVGFFLAVCGVLLTIRTLRPRGRSVAFRVGLGGAGINLAAGLMLGMVNLTGYLVPLELLTVDFVRSEVLAAFVAAVAAGSGLFLSFLGIAALLRDEPVVGHHRRGILVRVRRGKSIYEGVPSAR